MATSCGHHGKGVQGLRRAGVDSWWPAGGKRQPAIQRRMRRRDGAKAGWGGRRRVRAAAHVRGQGGVDADVAWVTAADYERCDVRGKSMREQLWCRRSKSLDGSLGYSRSNSREQGGWSASVCVLTGLSGCCQSCLLCRCQSRLHAASCQRKVSRRRELPGCGYTAKLLA
jgi:hypothetical protein